MLPLYLLSLPKPAPVAPAKTVSPSPLVPASAKKFSAPDYLLLKKFYLTTAINYTNGSPHFGHAYEAILSDMIVRYHRACGREVFFLTGTDEHGQKVQKSAEAAGRSPQAHCDFYADQFKALDEQLLIHYDRFVRTTSPEHKQTARRFWDLVKERGDLYLSSYEGWYNRNEEEYVSSSEVLKLGKHPVTGVPVDAFGRELERRASEECFFFKMSKYADKLREHIALNPNFIQPASCRAEIVSFLSNNVLDDLCVSRTSITWGVPIPDDSHANHVMYVWFDALTNYLTGVDALSDEAKGFWPCNVHIVGKDIVRFHTVYWPTMLMAAGLPLPQTIFGHGFVTDKMGVKMSKSLGNVSDPLDAAKLYGVDALRYYLARSSAFGWDLPYNEELLVNMNNDILLKGFGNLVQRCYKVTLDCSGNQLPNIVQPTINGKQHAFDLNELKSEFEACFAVLPTASSSVSEELESDDTQKCGLRVRDAMCALERAVGQTNAFVAECEPWKKKGDEHLAYRQECALVFMQAIYALAHFYRFFCPILADRVVKDILLTEFASSLGVLDFTGLQPGHPIRSGEEELVLVDGLEVGKGKKQRLTSGADKVKQREEERMKKVAQDAENKKNKEQAKFAQANSSVFDLMDIRVGIIKSAELVPGTKLFRERVQIGDEKDVIDVCSGLGGNYSAEQLVNRRVLVVLNLEPFTPKQLEGSGFVSTGLLLTGKEGDVIELLTPPTAARVGERMASSLLKELSEIVPKANDKQWSKVKHSFKVVDGKVSIGANSVLLGWECKQPCEPLVLVKTGAVV